MKKNFISIITENKDIVFSVISTIIIVAAIFIVVFEPFTEIPFIYNQF